MQNMALRGIGLILTGIAVQGFLTLATAAGLASTLPVATALLWVPLMALDLWLGSSKRGALGEAYGLVRPYVLGAAGAWGLVRGWDWNVWVALAVAFGLPLALLPLLVKQVFRDAAKPARKPKTYVFQDMRGIGVVLWATGCIRLLKEGDGFSFVFRPWHPVTWLVALAMVVPCALMGEKLTYVVPLRLSKFWRENIDQLQWVWPWTRIDTLKPFRFKPHQPT